jgi:nucleoside-diphosphate-sugar epimerase
MTTVDLPRHIPDVRALEDLLSDPPDYVVDSLRAIDGDVIVLGVAGKMGPTLARMARRALDRAGVGRRVIGVARFSSDSLRAALEDHGIETIRCDLLNGAEVDQLPDAPNVIFMAGRKFGSTGFEALTWAMNSYLPAIVCRRYSRSRMVVFSTGNVYGLAPTGHGGSIESDPPRPVGEYAMSCLGRERMFEYFSSALGMPAVILRLNYAVEMRYGVIADLAAKIARGQPIDVSMGYFNAIWQGDANAMAIASLANAAAPPVVVNIAGPEELAVRSTCEELGRLMARPVTFNGQEAHDALLSNGAGGWSLFGRPRVTAEQVIAWTADWVGRGGDSLERPTHFESRDGRF